MRIAALGLIFFVLCGSACAALVEMSASRSSPARRPVVLVHGIMRPAQMQKMAVYLRSLGWDARTMECRPCWGQKGIAELAVQLAAFVQENFPHAESIDLIGFSMGGLVSRYYLQRLGGLDRVQRFITISSPHRGSALAHLIPNPGCRDMRPRSALLRDLESDADRLRSLQFTSFWTPLDLMILPQASSVMPQARNVKLWVIAHPLMVWERRCLRAVEAALSENAPAIAPAAAASRAVR